MKKIFWSFIFFTLFFSLPVLAVEDVIDDSVLVDPDEINLEIDKVDIKENNLNKTEKPILEAEVSKIEQLEEYIQKGLSIKIDGPLIDEIRFGGAYQGHLTYDHVYGSSNDTVKYKIPVGDIYFLTKFADKKSEFKFMINPARTVKDVNYFPGILQDIYFSTKPTENTRVLIGHSRTPIGVEGGQSQYTLLLAQRSQISRTYGNIRALGVKLTGDYKWADYNIGIYDSSRFFTNMFRGPEFTGWVNFKPLANCDEEKYGKMLLGTGYNFGKRYNDYSVFGAYIGYEYKKLMLNAEYAYANGYNGVNNSRASSDGFYTTVAYKIHPKVEIVGRYDIFNPNRDVRHNNRTEITAGINYYVLGQKLKFVLNYFFRINENDKNSNGLYFVTQFMI